MTIREEWVDIFDTEPWELIEDGEDKGKIKEANYTYVQWLEQKVDDYRLMLKALANGWEADFFGGKWHWKYMDEEIEFEIKTIQSSIPEINDELREEFRKI